MNVLITCGGTAGHINPGLAVAGRIRELMPDARILFVGAHGNMETELVPREGFEIRTVKIAGFRRSMKPRMILKNIQTAGHLLGSLAESRRIIRQFKPDVAVGTGGYVCFPVLHAAASMGIPTVVHESNAVPGLTTKLLEKSIDRIMVGFEECRSHYRHPEKVQVTGTPVRVDFRGADKGKARRQLGLPLDEPMVLAVFGSLGADHMNAMMDGFIDRMGPEPDFRLVYATGKRYYERVKKNLEEKGISSDRIDVREYIYDMPRVLTASDVVICRSGASTISELTYLGKPAVIVPSPNVVNHHQEKNAAVLADAGAAEVMLEGQFKADELYDTVHGLLQDPERMGQMFLASRELGVDDATERITSILLELAEKKKSR